MAYTVILTPSFQRELEDLPRRDQQKVLRELRRLENNPFGPPAKIKKLKGQDIGQWRLEVWPYRVRYDVIGSEVVLYRVRHRRDIYRE